LALRLAEVAPLRNLDDLAIRVGAEIQEAPLAAGLGGTRALLIPKPGGFRIVVDTTPVGGWEDAPDPTRAAVARRRLRFLAAHELAHTCFYRRDAPVPRRMMGGSPAEESFCDRFAAALLLPDEAVRTLSSLSSLARIQEVYDVSTALIARRLAEVTGRQVALFYWRGSAVETSIQWSNVVAAGRLARWRNAVKRAVISDEAVVLASGEVQLLHSKRQALVVA
jgi:hypothetical protein